MSWNTHPSVVTGQTWSASDENTYVKGNLDTLWPYTAAQQVAYSTSSASLNKATAGAAYTFLRSNLTNTAIEFGALVVSRQGNSTASWASGSTANSTYTPPNALIQVGAALLSTAGTAAVTFPISYSAAPLVFTNYASTGGSGFLYPTAISTSGFTMDDVVAASLLTTWVAVGEK